MIDFSSININGQIHTKEITIGSNSIARANQLWPYVQSFLESGESLILFAAKTFTNATDGIKYGYKSGLAQLWQSSVDSGTHTYGRYKSGSVSDIHSDADSYTTTLHAGDTYLLLYTVSFSKTSS